MNEVVTLAVVWLIGIGLGAFHYGGLWRTVNEAVSSKRPALWFLGSWMLRFGVSLAGFYLVAGSDWKRLLICGLGFTLARFAVIRLTLTIEGKPAQEVIHAP